MRAWQHVAQQQNRRMFQMKRLERLRKDLELRERAEQLKLSKKMRWRQAMDQVDARMADMKVDPACLLTHAPHIFLMMLNVILLRHSHSAFQPDSSIGN